MDLAESLNRTKNMGQWQIVRVLQDKCRIGPQDRLLLRNARGFYLTRVNFCEILDDNAHRFQNMFNSLLEISEGIQWFAPQNDARRIQFKPIETTLNSNRPIRE
jgi:hypothetical protein